MLTIMRWTATVVAVALAVTAALYVFLVLGSRRGVKYFYG